MAIIKTPQAINTGEDVERRDSSYTVYKNVNWYSHYGERWKFLKKKKKLKIDKIKIKIKIDPAIPLVGIHPEKDMFQMDTGTPMFIVALFIRALFIHGSNLKACQQKNGQRRSGTCIQ